MSSGLRATGLSLTRSGRRIVEQVSLDLPPGSFTALLGANGAGKTTLLRLLLGLVAPSAGDVRLDGRPLATLGRRAIASRIAYVPQSHVPAFPFTVTEIVAMGRTPAAGWGASLGSADRRAIEGALERVNMLGFAHRNYAELSGGERQAVLIARALAQDARILLLDEPIASLDLGQQNRVMQTLSALTGEGFAVLASLHHPDVALRWCSDALVLQAGRVLAAGAVAQAVTGPILSTIFGHPVEIVRAGDRAFVRM